MTVILVKVPSPDPFREPSPGRAREVCVLCRDGENEFPLPWLNLDFWKTSYLCVVVLYKVSSLTLPIYPLSIYGISKLKLVVGSGHIACCLPGRHLCTSSSPTKVPSLCIRQYSLWGEGMLRYSVYVDIQCDPVRYNLIHIRTIYCGLGLYRHTSILIYIHIYIQIHWYVCVYVSVLH